MLLMLSVKRRCVCLIHLTSLFPSSFLPIYYLYKYYSISLKMASCRTIIRRHLQELKLFSVCAFYVSCNFFLLLLIPLARVFYKHWWCQVAIAVAVLDLLIPLRSGPKGSSQAFTDLCNISSGMRSYHNAEIIVEGGEYRRDKNYLICYFPHALYPYAFWLIYDYMKEHFAIRFLYTGADIVLWVPILRRIHAWWGFTKVSYKPLQENLQRPYPYNTLMLQPDGIRGMFYGINGKHEQVVLHRRRGFCRVALETGASLVPCYVFGANQLYRRTWGPQSRADRLSKKLGISFVYWTGRWGCPFGFMPAKTKLVVALGKPIPVSPVERPSKEQIEALHATFVQAIKDLYDRYKHKMGDEWATSHDRLYLENERPPDGTCKKDD
jgi:1-acyl-sn-glycerol-3-phosphate acyltransferase